MRRCSGENCQSLMCITPIGEKTECSLNEPAEMDSAFTSVNFLCIFQSEVPVLMNSLMFSYRGSLLTDDSDDDSSSTNVTNPTCSAQIDAFESAATGDCFYNPVDNRAYKAFCSIDGNLQ